jgi:hypothetical protein
MASSNLVIWNMSLGLLKNSNSVEDEQEDSFEAEQIRTYYETCVGFVLRDHLWNFAKKQVALASTGTPPTGWGFQYVYPTDCIKAGRIYNPIDPQDVRDDRIPFEVAKDPDSPGKVIWTNLDAAELIYGINVTDPSLWEPDFDNALSLYLAHKIAFSISNSRQRAADLLTLYYATFDTARTNNTREGTKNVDLQAEWIEDRA